MLTGEGKVKKLGYDEQEARMCVYIYVCMYVCMYVCVYIYIFSRSIGFTIWISGSGSYGLMVNVARCTGHVA